MNLRYILLIIFSYCALWGYSQRICKSLNDNWIFRFSHQVEKDAGIRVTIPHTWNAQDALSGKLDYKRGIGNYERTLYIDSRWKGKRLFLRFEGVNTIANVFVNGKYLGEHKGGYSAFVFEITDKVNYGKDNKLLVRVSNAERLDVMPLVGDFNMYGGIYRGVELIVTESVCISLQDYASPGVYLTQQKVTNDEAIILATILLSNRLKKCNVMVRFEVKDGLNITSQYERQINLEEGKEEKVVFPVKIGSPHLWNGKKDPFMYQTETTLWADGLLLDKVVQPLGIRYFGIDSNKGFFLNGEYLKLHGVCRHQDRPELGNALHSEHHEEDMHIMLEMGVNAVRLAHYQQSEDIYDLMDRSGIITWAEIPFVGPGGYEDKGFVNSLDFRENGKQQLRELIRQNYNHPSICFWGLFNELTEQGDNPVEYIRELNILAHSEDSSRPTTAASNQSGSLNFLTDCIAWNRYDGWYNSTPENLAEFLDETHSTYPDLCIGISEYGAGASIYHQQDSLCRPIPVSFWHPENWQTYYHMENWKIINERPFVWGSFVWNMFDFGAAHRHEGDRIGINDKGLVTFDRKIKKDAFYFYKANWNPEPMLYIAEKRCRNRTNLVQDITVFTNVGEVELLVNGMIIGKASPDQYATVKWKNVKLEMGENKIQVRTVSKQRSLQDECVVWADSIR